MVPEVLRDRKMTTATAFFNAAFQQAETKTSGCGHFRQVWHRENDHSHHHQSGRGQKKRWLWQFSRPAMFVAFFVPRSPLRPRNERTKQPYAKRAWARQLASARATPNALAGGQEAPNARQDSDDAPNARREDEGEEDNDDRHMNACISARTHKQGHK